MAKGISLPIAADTKQFMQAVQKGVIDPLEQIEQGLDAIDSSKAEGELDQLARGLDDVARDADRVGEKIGDELHDGIRQGVTDSERETERLTRGFRDLADDAKRQSRKIGDDLGDEVRKGAKSAERSLDGVKDEAGGTAREMAASFSGSSSDITGAIQEVAANAGAVYGPAGLFAGAAAAIGLGALTAEIERQQEEAAQLKEKLVDAYKSAAEEGRNYLDQEQINAGVRDILWDTDKMNRYRDEAAKIGVDVMTYVRGQAGDYDALEYAVDQARAAEEKRREEFNKGPSDAPFDPLTEKLGDIRGQLEGLAGQHRTNQGAAQQYADFMETASEEERAQIRRNREVSQARWEAEAEAIRGLPDAKVRVDVETPNWDAVHAAGQRRMNQLGALRIGATAVTKNGQPVW